MSESSAEYLGPLLRTLAETLDVRQVFERLSAEARRILPHDFLMLGLLTEDRQRVRVIALSGELPEMPATTIFPPELRHVMERDAFVLNDMRAQAADGLARGWLRPDGGEAREPVEMPLQPIFRHMVVEQGICSFLRVTVRLCGGIIGGVIFCSKQKDAFPGADVRRGREIADCVALALAHQRLAEEEKRSAEARERADRLALRVQRLTDELEQQGRHQV
ncbi:MAG: hypothetical protein ACHP85_17470, partial [Burkholderiales bacterium]